MEPAEETYKTVLSDLNSRNTQSENVCSFFSDFLLNCLSNPVNLHLFSDVDRLRLEQEKKRADEEISKELKKVNIELNGSVRSVFDSTDVYDSVLSRITGVKKFWKRGVSKFKKIEPEKGSTYSDCKSAIDLKIKNVYIKEKKGNKQGGAKVNSDEVDTEGNDCKSVDSNIMLNNNNTGKECSITSVKKLSNVKTKLVLTLPDKKSSNSKLSAEIKDETKVCDKECSLKTGHIDLDVNLVRRSRRFQKYWSSSCSSQASSFKHSSCGIKPIDAPPLTPSSFKIINMNLFINLSFYCGFCKRKINELYSLMGNKEALRSDLKFGFKDSLFQPVKKKTTVVMTAKKDEAMCIRIDNVFSTQLEDNSKSTDNDVLDLSVCNSKDVCDKETEPTEAIENNEKSAQDKQNEELLSDVLDLNSLEEESPLIIFEDPKLLEIDDDEVIDKLTMDCVTPVKTLVTKSPDKPPSNEKNKENTSSPIKTTQQILEEIYYKHKDKVNSGIIKKKSLKEKLDNMIQSDKTENKQIKRKVICSEPQKKQHRKNVLIGKSVLKRSEINPILPPLPSYEVKRIKNSIIKTVCVENDSSKLVDEYVPLVVFDEKEATLDHNKRTQRLNSKKRNSIKKLAKMLKKEKKKKELLKQAQINLNPPPGVDLNDYLLLQVEKIKQKLKEDEGMENNVLDVPDIIKGQVHADGAHDSSHRKVIEYSGPELEQGELEDSSDENHGNKSQSYKTPDTTSHSCQNEVSDDERITKSIAHRSLSPSRTPEDRGKWIKLSSRSPVSYSKTRFRSRSRSPLSKCRKYSPLRDRRSSPSKRHNSPDNKYKSCRRNRSRTPDKRRYSTDKHYHLRSPHDKRYSPHKPYHSRSPERRRYSKSPQRRRYSKSPDLRRYSKSPQRRRYSKSPQRRRYSKSPERRRYSKSPERRRSPERYKHHSHKSHHEARHRSRTPVKSKNHRDNRRSDSFKKSCVKYVNYSRHRSPEHNYTSSHRSNEYRNKSPKTKAISPDSPDNLNYPRKEASYSKRHEYHTSPRRSRYSRSPEEHSPRNAKKSPPHRSYQHNHKDFYSPVSFGSFSPDEKHPASPHSEAVIMETTTTTVVQEEIVTIEL